jgi:hypothetical protein
LLENEATTSATIILFNSLLVREPEILAGFMIRFSVRVVAIVVGFITNNKIGEQSTQNKSLSFITLGRKQSTRCKDIINISILR